MKKTNGIFMKWMINFFWVLLYVAVPTSGTDPQNEKSQFAVEKVTNANYPVFLPSPKGKIVDAIKWSDRSGTNILVISEFKKGTTLQKGFASELFASQFLLKGGTYDTIWKIKDFNYKDSDIEYAPGTLKLLDIDNDGDAESLFFYTISSVDHQITKLILHTKGQKLVIRGYYTIFDSGDEPREDSLVVDPAFNKVNSTFKKIAIEEWHDVTDE
jgi:hypothetical protein